MKRLAPWLNGFLTALALTTLLGGLSGCKQDVGEVCQINSDCKDGLTCVQSTKLCGPGSDGGAATRDAAPTVDAAPTPDGGDVDAAAVDAAPTIDAAPAADATADAS